jgi:hypothetical protein
MIHGQVMERTNLLLSVEGQLTQAVLTQTCMGVFFICSASDTIFTIFFLLKPPADGRWSANYSLRNTAVDANFRESAPVLHRKQ